MKIDNQYEHKECPRCFGKGYVLRRMAYTVQEKQKAYFLWQKGLSLRQIGKKLKIPHPQTISNLIKQYKKLDPL